MRKKPVMYIQCPGCMLMLKSISLCEHANHGLAVEQNEIMLFWLNYVCNQNESRFKKLWLKNFYRTTNVDLHVPLDLHFDFHACFISDKCSLNECVLHFHYQLHVDFALFWLSCFED